MRVISIAAALPVLVTLGSFSTALAQRGGHELPSPFSITDPKTATALVASVGPISITAQQFLLSYEFGPSFTKREKDSKKRYLDFMIDEKLLALDGYARRLQWTGRARASLAEIEGDLATEELYRDDVLSRVKVTKKEISHALRGERVHRTVRWLYSTTEEGIRGDVDQIRSGVPFDSLFGEELKAGVKAGDRSMQTTMFRLRLDNPLLAAVVDTIRPRRPSAAIKGPDGWYILCVVDGWTDVLSTDADDAKLLADVRDALTQHKADSLSDRYVRALMLKHDPEIVRRTFDLLRAWLGTKWLTPATFSSWMLTNRFAGDWDSTDAANIDRFDRNALVTLKGDSVSLGEFLSWYHHREFAVRLDVTTPQAFFVSIEQSVWHMVRDKLLVRRALERKLQNRESVRTQKKWWEEKIVYALVKESMADSIALDDSTLERYYREHPRSFRDTTGAAMPFDRVRDDVRKEVYTSELTRRMFHRILALKRLYPVEIREDVLKQLPVEPENNPNAIDVYLVKKGGVFPHPAFPVIDYDWQTWE